METTNQQLNMDEISIVVGQKELMIFKLQQQVNALLEENQKLKNGGSDGNVKSKGKKNS